MPDGEEDRDRGDEDHQPEGHRLRQQVPERVGREEAREEDRDARGFKGVRGDAPAAATARLAHDEQRDAAHDADREPDRGPEQPLVDGVLEEEDRGEEEGDAGDPGEETDADEVLPVEGTVGGRLGCGCGCGFGFGCRLGFGFGFGTGFRCGC